MIAVLDRRDVLDGVPRIITSEAQNDRYTAALLGIQRRGRLTAADANLAQVLTLLIEAYEEEHYPIPSASPVDVLKELMAANNLRQKDLASILGSESAVSGVLHGRRKLNRNHIERLSTRFNVSPAVFF